MPRVSFITTCMGRLEHLRRALPTWTVQPGCEVVVVDFSCPDGAGDWIEAKHPGIRVVRVPGERLFHRTRARNLGAAAAGAEWLCFIDADILLDPDFGAQVFPQLDASAFWRAESGSPEVFGTVLCPRRAFDAIGGYDEAMEGWGSEDVDFFRRLAAQGLAHRTFPGRLIEAIAHGDELRVANAPIPEKDLGWLVNLFYLEAKTALMRMHGGELDLPTRKSLYAEARRTVLEAMASGRDGLLELSTGLRDLAGPFQVEQKLLFTLRHPR